jgi:Fe-Mn family superoxide dismutase
MMTRRQALKKTALATVACAAATTIRTAIAQPAPAAAAPAAPAGPFTLPPLPYAYDALEPHIDAQTMQIHHDKHHAAYVANLNKAVASWNNPAITNDSVVEMLLDLNAVPESDRTAVRNNGGGHSNHSLFWQMMKKGGGGEPKTELARAIDSAFGSFSAFKDNFTKAALGQFGSGWAWLVLGSDKKLTIRATANQDTPISDLANNIRHTPLLGLDVWEHAYYLKYQNKRADYITAWFNVVNWDFVAERYAKLKS